ncbi:TPMT family class I SAM-dependent methyltransferase [Flavobacterium galactosidilyticum]|uniref:methyltransferase domain-containing protein n=1 Tax=Flavobacterium galactosidilyticum TaxID=2893886 RepID=UPI001E31EE4B|nr:methyltransferase domain-containing protein [Flavobacterium sp. F-340]UFH45183.1 TPMT family class I SAM-dependent methyltransferase [Flavobacterium sp. F-340]
MEDNNCCVISCENPIDASYWEAQYQSKSIGWDLGFVSPPIKEYIDKLENKNCSILIPGCGNTYEAEYLLEQGFTNVTVIDIAPSLVAALKDRFKNNTNITIVLGDFFDHQGKYDLIIEQTFFCALPPALRQKYVYKMHDLLVEKGILAGLLFNRSFEKSPPFGGSKSEYEKLFSAAFKFEKMDTCLNSATPRLNSELFIGLKKNSEINVKLYNFGGITCSNCAKTITDKFLDIDGIVNASINSNFTEVLICSKNDIAIEILRDVISYDSKYTMESI